MSTSLAWTEDDDTLSQNTNVYGLVASGQTKGLKAATVAQSKANITSDKSTAKATAEQQSTEQKSAVTGLIMSVVETGASIAMMGIGGGGAAGKEAALAGKSADVGAKGAALSSKAQALDVKSVAAFDAGKGAKAARLGNRAAKVSARSGKLAGRSADLASKSQAYGYKARYGGKLLKPQSGPMTSQDLALHNEQMGIINATGNLGPAAPASGGDYWNPDMGATLAGTPQQAEEYRQKMAISEARWKENPMNIPGSN